MSLESEDYRQLLEEYKKFEEKNNRKIESGEHDYNLMNALLKKTDEVNLHSNFIYSMINPKGRHYCQHNFLELFLKTIEKDHLIADISNAEVFKEKGKIDLLIKDNQNIIIIENKLRAPDQMYQISRYIKYVIDRYLNDEDKELIGSRVHVVYLSEYKAVPSKDKESTKGFKELNRDSTELIWDNVNVSLETTTTSILKDTTNTLELPKDTKISFKRVRHSDHLHDWTEKAKKWLADNRPNSSTLLYAFDEYQQILLRLKKNNRWRKLMELDEYILNLEHESDEKKMYQFMLDAEKKLSSYKGKKLFQAVNEKLESYNNIDKIGKVHLKKFNETACTNWFKQKGNREKWNNVALEFEKQNEKYILALGTKYIYFGEKTDEFFKEVNRLDNIDINSNIFLIVETIEKHLEKFRIDLSA